MEHKDPVVAAYEKATGKKYELTNPYDVSAFKKDPSSEMATEEKKATSDAESKSNKKENPENKHKSKLKK